MDLHTVSLVELQDIQGGGCTTDGHYWRDVARNAIAGAIAGSVAGGLAGAVVGAVAGAASTPAVCKD
jgi:hypothetical protein